VLARQGRFHFAQINLPLRAGRWNQFGSTCVKFARAAFVVVDMRVLVTDDTVKWLAKLCQRERVGGRPIGDEKNVAIDFKKFTDAITQALSPLIITVSCRCAGIRVLKRSARFRAKARGIVARELLAPLNHAACRYPSLPIRAIE
jgi:hypothetical protein